MKKQAITLLLFLLVFSTCTLYGQEEVKEQKFIGVEAGYDYQNYDILDFDFIRGDNSYYGHSGGQSVDSYFNKWSFGVKGEWIPKSQVGFIIGLRYINVSSGMVESSSKSFFHFLLQQNGTSTEYLRIKEINQHTTYLGVPIELRLFPFKVRTFSPFIKFAVDFNYRLNTKNEVVFVNEAMSEYKEQVMDRFDEPDNFYSSFYMSSGFRIAKKDAFCISIEAKLPVFYISKKLSSFNETNVFGFGFQLNFQIPILK